MYNIKRNTLQIEPTTCPMTPFLITAFPWPLITKRRHLTSLSKDGCSEVFLCCFAVPPAEGKLCSWDHPWNQNFLKNFERIITLKSHLSWSIWAFIVEEINHIPEAVEFVQVGLIIGRIVHLILVGQPFLDEFLVEDQAGQQTMISKLSSWSSTRTFSNPSSFWTCGETSPWPWWGQVVAWGINPDCSSFVQRSRERLPRQIYSRTESLTERTWSLTPPPWMDGGTARR